MYKQRNVSPETAFQRSCYQWMRYMYPSKSTQIFHLLQNPKSARHGALLNSMGFRAGVPDFMLLTGAGVVFIELKTLKGVQSKAQKDFQELCDKLGIKYYVARTLAEFSAIIFECLGRR